MPATPAQTRAFFDRLKAKGVKTPPTNVLGKTGLTVSRMGFGGYRVHEFEPENRQALRDAILGGINLIDTSTNYTDGSSERLVGDVTRELIVQGLITREEFVIVSKAGYVQGTAMREAKERVGSQRAFPEMVEFQQDCWHNISPAFLEEQITKSLQRMKVDAIDVLLLHNPEYFLKAGGTRDKYYDRIDRAFKHLESEVSKGRIKSYGISSNTFPEVESRSDFTSLSRIWDLAQAISPEHHFRVIQFPFNLYEAGAAIHLNNNRQNIFDFASSKGLAILTNRPYNAFAKGRVSRLTSFPTHDEVEIKGGLHTTLGRAIELEKKAPGWPKSAQGFQWAHALRDKLSEMDDLLAWREALYGQVYPSIRQALQRVDAAHAQWAQDYQTAVTELLKLVTMDLENLAEKKSLMLAEQLNGLADGVADSKTLSQKVMRLYLAFPAISTVLVGMRTPKYVADALGVGEAVTSAKANEVLLRLQRYRS